MRPHSAPTTGRPPQNGHPLRASHHRHQGGLRIATLTDTQLDEVLTVEAWREEVLLAAGYPKNLARTIAAALDIDLHTATDIIDAGCPPRTAAKILL